MELIDQHTKKIMEGCKERARDEGLKFEEESLEYIVSNKDLLELSPKLMIPTLYDYWVHDVEVLKEKGKYELYPHNPYETVINTRPAISFYNDNNPDWLNVMIFYHVLGHIDFFQNNTLYTHTWDEDFAGRALSDKRLISMLRSEKGRWVDYVIEFTRGIDNLVGFYRELADLAHPMETEVTERLDFYFDHFLQTVKRAQIHEYLKEIKRYNDSVSEYGDMGESLFFSEVMKKYPEFDALLAKHKREKKEPPKDLIQHLIEHSSFLQKEENRWMKSVMQIVRKTSLFFQPQIRTRILNEGWASYWHERLFLKDDRINGHEVDFARVNAKVTSVPRVGINPYALGMRLFQYIEDLADHGKLSYDFQRLESMEERKGYDGKTGDGLETLFKVREDFSDFLFINTFVDQDFMDRHKLFVAGKRMNVEKGIWEYYVKSRDADRYKEMMLNQLYHPPHIRIDEAKAEDGYLYLDHHFEGKPLVNEFIKNTMLGIEYLWGGPVKLETSEMVAKNNTPIPIRNYLSKFNMGRHESEAEEELEPKRVLYTMENRELSRTIL